MPTVQFRVDVHKGFSGSARNSLRKTRILNRLRGIRRLHPTLNFEVKRGVDFITVHFGHDTDQTMFALLWPAGHPSWETIDNDIS